MGAASKSVLDRGMGRDMVDSDRIDNLIAAVPPALALRAGLDLGIFTQPGGSAVTADSLGAVLKVEPNRLSRLLYALASIGLLEVKDGQFRNAADASAFLDASKPDVLVRHRPLRAAEDRGSAG